MSYVRWSSIIDADLTGEEFIQTMGMSIEERLEWCQQHKNPTSYLSDWYIFWHSMGKEFDGETRQDQHLAMWNCNKGGTPTCDYDTVKTMLETDDWSPLGFENLTQKEVLIDCVTRWLNDVEEEFSND